MAKEEGKYWQVQEEDGTLIAVRVDFYENADGTKERFLQAFELVGNIEGLEVGGLEVGGLYDFPKFKLLRRKVKDESGKWQSKIQLVVVDFERKEA